ncbi:hypothetical protein K435DRAFT_836190 [Dendrothele bispora CBS 962.96]|uniref:Uncharacterized protein n=1 Tax=Dendrothele bispora (strain CBS 962.96) TaxID=1314807 RepID=A0A4S8MJ85_DENBC|nr:hypothetical protein K435DRAFT_836190 [Dendrothele bispora CBS 962.96]
MPSIKLLPAATLLAGHVLAIPIGQQQSATSDSNNGPGVIPVIMVKTFYLLLALATVTRSEVFLFLVLVRTGVLPSAVWLMRSPLCPSSCPDNGQGGIPVLSPVLGQTSNGASDDNLVNIGADLLAGVGSPSNGNLQVVSVGAPITGNPVLPVSVNTPSGSGGGLGNVVSDVIPFSPVNGPPSSSGNDCIENLCHDLANLENGNGLLPEVNGTVESVVINGNSIIPTVDIAINSVAPTVDGAINGVAFTVGNTLNNVVSDVDKTLSSVTVNARESAYLVSFLPLLLHPTTQETIASEMKAGAGGDCRQNAPDSARLVHKFQENDGDLNNYICAYYDSCQAISNVNDVQGLNTNENLVCMQ